MCVRVLTSSQQSKFSVVECEIRNTRQDSLALAKLTQQDLVFLISRKIAQIHRVSYVQWNHNLKDIYVRLVVLFFVFFPSLARIMGKVLTIASPPELFLSGNQLEYTNSTFF